MGKIAFVFSGQGDQYPGMGKEIYEKYSTAKNVFDVCNTLRPKTSDQCFCGSVDELKETKNTQPCLFAMEMAAAHVLVEKGIVPTAVAGFSLGEVTAAAASGLFDIKTGFELVCKRGELMSQAAQKEETFMAAVLKLTKEQLDEICRNYTQVYPVNYNCPGQITVSGILKEKTAFFADVKAAGGRALLLNVQGAFHSPFMNEAASVFAVELTKVEINPQKIRLYSNVTAKPYDERVVNLLSEQICNPVQWEDTIRNMIGDGIDTFVEIGPGKTLTNMIKKIDKNVRAVSYQKLLEEEAGEVESC